MINMALSSFEKYAKKSCKKLIVCLKQCRLLFLVDFFLHIFLENIYYCGENKWVMSQVILPMYVNTTYTFFIITPNTKQQSLPEMHFVKLHLFFVHYKETILC